jgi:Calcineurin-like phosphoesterase
VAQFRRKLTKGVSTSSNKQELFPVPPPLRAGPIQLADLVGAAEIAAIQKTGVMQFQATGDAGVGINTNQPKVAEALARDIDVNQPANGPVFFLNLGDVIYGNGKSALYANRFYRPNMPYLKPAPGFEGIILAIPGNHDGEVRDPADNPSLIAFQENFVQPLGSQPPMAISFGVKMINQPGVYWLLDAPFLDLIGLYSNAGEETGLLGVDSNDTQQTGWLTQTLTTIKQARKGERKALIFAVHHPPYGRGLQAAGFGHPGSTEMLAQLDAACNAAGIWPDAVLSGHSHNYQRYKRHCVAGPKRAFDIPYFVVGTGGISLQPAPTGIGAQQVENPVPPGLTQSTVTYSNGDENYGFVRVAASASQLKVTFVRALENHRQEFETVTMDLASQTQLSP